MSRRFETPPIIPLNAGVGKILTSDGAGNASWQSAPTGLISSPVTVGNGSLTSITVTHNLGTQEVDAVIRQTSSPFERVYPTVANTTTNTITLTFGVAPATNQYTVTCFAGSSFSAAVTSLPGSPVSGQEVTYARSWTDTSGVARKVYWHLKWDSTDSHWYKMGGSPLFDFIDTQQSLAVTFSTYQDLATAGPKLTMPLTGVYLLQTSAYSESAAAQANLQYAIAINGTTFPNVINGLSSTYVAGGFETTSALSVPQALTAADVVKMQYHSNANQAADFGLRRLWIDPIYVN